MYLCAAAAPLKGIWLEGGWGRVEGKEAVWSADREWWGAGGGECAGLEAGPKVKGETEG